MVVELTEGRKTGAKTYGSSQAWDETFSSEEFRVMNEKDKASRVTLVLEDSPCEETKPHKKFLVQKHMI